MSEKNMEELVGYIFITFRSNCRYIVKLYHCRVYTYDILTCVVYNL